MQLSPNFSLAEFTRSAQASALGIANAPSPADVTRLRALCVHVLQPLRDALGSPVHISSGYRSSALNGAVRGSARSQHMLGEAADISVRGLSPEDLAARIVALGLPVDQVIWYAHYAGAPDVHVSHTTQRPNRGQRLHSPRPKVYVPWAPARP
jgi:uncharacterized protein YcbK (DUF882 family)